MRTMFDLLSAMLPALLFGAMIAFTAWAYGMDIPTVT